MSHLDRPATLGQLRDTGYTTRTVKQEIRANLLDRLRSGEPAFPGIVGFDDTVLPELETRAARRPRPGAPGRARPGQDPTDAHPGRAARRVEPGRRRLRDQRRPAALPSARAAARLLGGGRRRRCRSPGGTATERYTEKLATPDTSVGDLVGDVDPVKVAQGRTLGDPETVHYGLVPRTNRGVFGLNELPDLAERIQVAMFNVLEERDIQIRGYSLRLPLDLLLVATRQPRGLHQPRPDHHAAEGPLRRRDPHPLPARGRRRGAR